MFKGKKRVRFQKAFTLIEAMVVVIILSIIIGFAVPQYREAIVKSHERDIILQLRGVHAANKILVAKQGQRCNPFSTTSGTQQTSDLSLVNSCPGINVINTNPNHLAYVYGIDFPASPEGFWMNGNWSDPAGDDAYSVSILISSGDVGTHNPCCAFSTGSPCRIVNPC